MFKKKTNLQHWDLIHLKAPAFMQKTNISRQHKLVLKLYLPYLIDRELSEESSNS